MPLVPFQELMAEAQRGCYAVGCFETWDQDSLLAVADAAEKLNAPVVIGLSGTCLPQTSGDARNQLSLDTAASLDVCRRLTVPCCLMFSESTHLNAVHAALELGFNLVTFRESPLATDLQLQIMRGLAGWAHCIGAAVEAAPQPLAHVNGSSHIDKTTNCEEPMTTLLQAEEFIQQTCVDALVVNIAQSNRHNGSKVRLDLSRLAELSHLPVPLVLHDAAMVDRKDLRAAAKQGIRKVNVGPMLKQVYLQAFRDACRDVSDSNNSLNVAGSSFENHVLPAARHAMQQSVEEFLQLVGSAGKASRAGKLTA